MSSLKYVETEIVFREIPDEITLAINISNCPNRCSECHSKHLWEDIGKPLTWNSLKELINKNKGISCVCFMGGDNDTLAVNFLAENLKESILFPFIKVGWYSGLSEIRDNINIANFDYIKVGPYIKELGPLDNPNTNQKFYEVCRISKLPPRHTLIDKTYLFWKR